MPAAIILQTFIAASVPDVWAALDAHAALLFDGLPATAWPEGEQQAPLHRAMRWPYTEAAGAATKVSVTLHEMGGGTRLDLRHEGWGEGPAWDESIQGHFAGWLHGLAALGTVIECGVDARASSAGLAARERYFVSGEIKAAAEAVYRSLTDAAVRSRWSMGLFDGAEPVQVVENRVVRWTMPAGAEVVALLRPTPRGTHLAIAEYGVADRGASAKWPGMFERLARFLG